MPTYEYKCQSCGQLFEVRQRFSDEPLTTHEACGGPVERLISPPALQFKGSGFYITDYAKGSNTSSAGKGASSESKSDSKPASSTPAPSSSSSTSSDKK